VFQLVVDELPKLKSDQKNGGEGGREFGENRMLWSLCIRLRWIKKSGNCWVRLLLRVRTTMEAGARLEEEE
jgi:hypothetical protein